MTLELKCKQEMCLQKMQRGCRFQCMSVFGVLCNKELQRKAEIKGQEFYNLPLLRKAVRFWLLPDVTRKI